MIVGDSERLYYIVSDRIVMGWGSDGSARVFTI